MAGNGAIIFLSELLREILEMGRIRYGLLLALIVGITSICGCGNSGAQPAGDGKKEESVTPQEATPAESAGQTEAASSAGTSAAGTETAPQEEEEPQELVAEFEPNTEYDKYALVYYIVEDIDARFVATVSAREDGSEYEVHCSVDGEEQVVKLDKELTVTSDMTGNLSYDAPLIVKKAVNEDKWIEIEKD